MDVFLGTVQAFGFNFAPRGWALCNGQLLNINANTALFSLMGTTYGGNGQTTFGLPNLQGRTIVGMGTSVFGHYEPGQMSGNANITLQQSQMPMHTHAATGTGGSVSVTMMAVGEPGSLSTPAAGSSLAAAPGTTKIYSADPGDIALAPATGNISNLSVTLSMAGGSQPVNIESPYLAMNYSICVQGIFPSRN